MFKNILILCLVVASAYFGYQYFVQSPASPFYKETIEKELIDLGYYIKVYLKDGGEAEGKGIVVKKDKIDLIVRDGLTTSMNKSSVSKIEKVFNKTGKVVEVKKTEWGTVSGKYM